MTADACDLKDAVIEAVLPRVEEEGWVWDLVEDAVEALDAAQCDARDLFPNGMMDVVAHFSDYIDRAMLAELDSIPYDALRTKDRVRAAAMSRFQVMAPNREAVRQAMAFWAVPTRSIQGQRVLWRTSDRIWTWAGDQARDYTRQTKRAMLSSILMGTVMVWITDESKDIMVTQAFLDRRLENAMEIGKTIGTMKSVVPNLFRQARRS